MGLRGVDGHTAGAYDLAPEALLADGFIRGEDNVYPVLFDEAGHRVALQYAMAAFNGDLAFDLLLKYLFNRAKMKWSATEAMVLLWPLATQQVGFHGLEPESLVTAVQELFRLKAFRQSETSALNRLDDEQLSMLQSMRLLPHELPTERRPEQPRTTFHYESRSTTQLRHRPC